jgi:hypothetical protein
MSSIQQPGSPRPGTSSGRSLNQTLALAFGGVYALVGLAGFLVTGDVPFVGERGSSLLGFDVNGLHNLVHLAIGVALLAASRTLASARAANLAIGATYLVLGLLGPVLNDSAVDIIGLNGADHVLHLLSGALLTGVALLADKSARSATRV